MAETSDEQTVIMEMDVDSHADEKQSAQKTETTVWALDVQPASHRSPACKPCGIIFVCGRVALVNLGFQKHEQMDLSVLCSYARDFNRRCLSWFRG